MRKYILRKLFLIFCVFAVYAGKGPLLVALGWPPGQPGINMAADGSVDEKIGEEAVTLILEAVDENSITQEHLKTLSYKLDKNGEIGGNHTKRIGSGKSDGAEMRHILSDWWLIGDLSEISQIDAIERLYKIIEPFNRPLTNKLKKLLHTAAKEVIYVVNSKERL